MSFKRSIVSENLEVIATLSGSGTGISILPGRVGQGHCTSIKKNEKHSHLSG